jgi:hypothetical protein
MTFEENFLKGKIGLCNKQLKATELPNLLQDRKIKSQISSALIRRTPAETASSLTNFIPPT